MTKWIRRTVDQQGDNGTNSHTFTFPAATAGNFLMAIGYGQVTFSTPTGWTLRASAVNFGGLYVWTKTASAGESSFTTTHNGSGWKAVLAVYEFASGTTWGTASGAFVGWNAQGPTLTGLTGTNLLIGAMGVATTNTSIAHNVSWSSPTGTIVEDVDVNAFATSGTDTDGYTFSDAYIEGSTSSSFTATGQITTGDGTGKESLSIALKPAAAVPSGTGSGTFSFAGSTTGRKDPKGSASAGFSFAGSATGQRSPRGSGSGTVSFASSGSGSKSPVGQGSGTVSFAGSGSGSAPSAPPATGSGSGTLSWSSSATGRASKSGSGTGAMQWAGSASGSVAHEGHGSGTLSLSSSGSGLAPMQGAGSSSFAWAGAGAGDSRPSGQGSVGFALAAAATGAAPSMAGQADITVKATEARTRWRGVAATNRWEGRIADPNPA